MSYSYLLDLYKVLDERIKTIVAEASPDNSHTSDQHYCLGRRDCLADFKTYLTEHYHHKLPRRMQKSCKPAQSPK